MITKKKWLAFVIVDWIGLAFLIAAFLFHLARGNYITAAVMGLCLMIHQGSLIHIHASKPSMLGIK